MAAGLYCYNDEKPYMVYIEKNKVNKKFYSDKVWLDLLNQMFKHKYDNYTFYCHNLGGYDAVFFIRSLYNINESYKNETDFNAFGLEIFCRKDKVLKLTISRKVGKKRIRKIKIVDSMVILPESVKDLGKKFDIDENLRKGAFPHKFSSTNAFTYLGKTPDFSYYKKDDCFTFEDYKLLVKDDWSYKTELLSYLDKDLRSLYEVLKKANESFWLKSRIQMTDSLTISKLALEIFLKDHYKPDYLTNHIIPLIKDKGLYDDIKQAYYGGMTEVYKPRNSDNENLYYYDVNSLYPYVALNDMPGHKVSKMNIISDNHNLQDLFGFFYCEIECDENYLGLLPVNQNNLLIFPNGKWKGWYFSEELKYASNYSYKIKLIKGYNFNRVSNVFTTYVNNLYAIKSNKDDQASSQTAKLLLNSLLGRFGLDINTYSTALLKEDTIQKLNLTRNIYNQTMITDDISLVTYNSKIDLRKLKKWNLYYSKASDLEYMGIKDDSNIFNQSSV